MSIRLEKQIPHVRLSAAGRFGMTEKKEESRLALLARHPTKTRDWGGDVELAVSTGAAKSQSLEDAIDPRGCEIENGDMSELNPEARRGGRLFYKLRVQAKGRAHNGRKFTETCSTVVVNPHGGLLLLKHEVDEGEMLVLIHPESLEEQECRVVYLGEQCDKGQRVGVEFLTPAPHFWGLECDEPVSANNNSTSSIH
jgi:hypothetical protein